MEKLNIAIDGHSSSGKSTISKGIAKQLNIKRLDTGAIYRGIACEWVKQKLGDINSEKIDAFVKDLQISINFINDAQQVVVNNNNHTENLRLNEISALSSKISPFEKIRDKVKDLQRDFAKNYDCVIEGRDIASVIIPNADFKFFISTDVKVRAERRCKENLKMGIDSNFEDILKAIINRDFLDETREIAPLIKTDDAILVDNSRDGVEKSIEFCVNLVKKSEKYMKILKK